MKRYVQSQGLPIDPVNGFADNRGMDWKILILELMAEGLTQAEIGKHCGLSQPTISDLANAKIRDINWTSGERLRALHASATSSTHNCRPGDEDGNVANRGD